MAFSMQPLVLTGDQLLPVSYTHLGPGARPGRIGYGENGNTWIPTYYTNAKGEPSLIGASTLGWGLPLSLIHISCHLLKLHQ